MASRPLLVLLALAVTAPAAARPYLRKPAHGFQMRVDPYTVAPGQDLEVCEYRRLPNKKAMDVNGFSLRMPPGAHHFVMWAYGGNMTDDSLFPKGPVPSLGCTGISPDEIAPQVLIPIQTPNARFRFPDGLALHLEPGEQVWLNPHMKNPETTAITPDIRFNFYRAPKRKIVHRVQGLIIGNTFNIHIPAGGDQSLTAEWTAPVDLTLVELQTHQHRLGTYGNIQIVDPDGTVPPPIYENTAWDHPTAFWPAGGIHLAKGRKVRITCQWHNTDDHTVTFGGKTTDEMCFILGFYYRDNDATDPVVGGGCVPARRGLLCPLVPAVTN